MHTKIRSDIAISLLLLFVLVALSLYLAFHTHPYGDDYCHAIRWKNGAGWYEYVHSFWSTWSGSWAAITMNYFYFDVIGLSANWYWIVTVAALCAICIGFTLASRLLYGRSISAFVWAILCTVIFIALASAIDALLFWMVGVAGYTSGYFFVPLALGLAVTVISSEERPSWWLMLVAGICLLWSGGLVVLFLVPVVGFLLGSLLFSQQKLRVFFLSLFALAGILINILAPGNAQRRETSDLDIDFIEIVTGTLFYGFRGLILPILALAILSSLPFIAASVKQLVIQVQKRLDKKLILVIASFTVLYPFAIEFALFWSLGAPGPGRAHNISPFTLIVSWPVILAAIKLKYPALSFTIPAYGKTLVQIVAIALLFAVNPLKMTRNILSGESYRYHQAVVSAEYELTRSENKGGDVVLPTNDLATTDENHWLNKCLASYFSVNTVRAVTQEQ